MTEVGSVYGQALYGLAREEQADRQIMQELTVLDTAFSQEPDFLRLLASPHLPKQERCQVADDTLRGKVHPYVLNFIKILTERGYVRHFSACAASYREQYNLDNGILPVTAVTAVAMSDAQNDKLTEKLQKITGKHIDLTNKLDPTVIGGMRLDYDGKRVDDTVSHRLETVRGMLKNTVL